MIRKRSQDTLRRGEIERVVMNALKERLSNARWLADQIRGQAREASLAGILRTIEQRVAEEDIMNEAAKSQNLLGIIERINAHKDRLLISVDLAALA